MYRNEIWNQKRMNRRTKIGTKEGFGRERERETKIRRNFLSEKQGEEKKLPIHVPILGWYKTGLLFVLSQNVPRFTASFLVGKSTLILLSLSLSCLSILSILSELPLFSSPAEDHRLFIDLSGQRESSTWTMNKNRCGSEKKVGRWRREWKCKNENKIVGVKWYEF